MRDVIVACKRVDAIEAFEANYDQAIVPNNVIDTISAIDASDTVDAVMRSMQTRGTR